MYKSILWLRKLYWLIMSQKIKFWVDTHQAHQFFLNFFGGEFFGKFSSNSAGFTAWYRFKNSSEKNLKKIDVPDVYQLKIEFFETIPINKALSVIKLICTHVAHVIYAQFWIWKKLIFRSISRCKSSRFYGKISKNKIFSKLEKNYVPDVYWSKIIIFA